MIERYIAYILNIHTYIHTYIHNDLAGSRKLHWKKAVMELTPCVCLLIVDLVADTYVQPFQRSVSDYDGGPTISHPVLGEIVSTGMLVLLAWVIPWIIILAVCLPKRDVLLFYR